MKVFSRMVVCWTMMTVFVLPIPGWTEVDLTVPQPLENRFISLEHDDRALVVEDHGLVLDEGENQFSYNWEGTGLDPSTLALRLPDDEDLTVSDVRLDRDSGTKHWTLTSPTQRTVSVRLRYLLRGVRRSVGYRGVLAPGGETMELIQESVLTNHTGMSFEDASIGVNSQLWTGRSWEPRETKRLATSRSESIPVRVIHRFDPFEHGDPGETRIEANRLPVVREFLPPAGDGNSGLRTGRFRLFQDDGERLVFLGEDRIDPTPPGDTVVLVTGRTGDVTVDRTIVERQRSNRVTDDRGRLQKYDETVTVELTASNHTTNSQRLRLLEPMDGEWEMIESSHSYRRRSNQQIEVETVLDPDEEVIVRFVYERRNVMP